MPFITMDGVDGLIYVPEAEKATDKKHPCPDCEACQHCSDSRCNICLRDQRRERKSTCGRRKSCRKPCPRGH